MTTPLSDATAGALGSAVANAIVFPLDVIKTRLQVQTKAHKVQYKSTQHALLTILKDEGLPGLYAGLSSGLIGTVISSFSYFWIYGTVRGAYQKKIGSQTISTAMELGLGATAGALCQFVVLPIGIITTRQQTDPQSQSLYATFKAIVGEDGVQELWKGLRASLVLCVNPAITFGMFERIKGIWMKRLGKQLTSGQIFLIGALSKALATVVTCIRWLTTDPYIMAKVRMQWKAPKGAMQKDVVKYRSAAEILKTIYRVEGLKGWYFGMETQILKAVLSQAIVFTIKEKLALYTMIFFQLVQ